MNTGITLKLQSIDRKLSASRWYRVFRWLLILTSSLLAGLCSFLLATWLENIDYDADEDDEEDNYGYTNTGPTEGWDSNEKGWESTAHFYDNEPPPPFS